MLSWLILAALAGLLFRLVPARLCLWRSLLVGVFATILSAKFLYDVNTLAGDLPWKVQRIGFGGGTQSYGWPWTYHIYTHHKTLPNRIGNGAHLDPNYQPMTSIHSDEWDMQALYRDIWFCLIIAIGIGVLTALGVAWWSRRSSRTGPLLSAPCISLILNLTSIGLLLGLLGLFVLVWKSSLPQEPVKTESVRHDQAPP